MELEEIKEALDLEEVLVETRRVDGEIDEILPLLITDQWEMVVKQLPTKLLVIKNWIELIIEKQNELENNNVDIDFSNLTDVLKQIVWGFENADAIQLADILAYELGDMIREIYQGMNVLMEET